MRPLLGSDISAAARALLAVAEADRPDLCTQMINEADQADRYTRRSGSIHPVWGNGTLRAAAFAHGLADEPTFDDENYCNCFCLVLAKLADRRAKRDLYIKNSGI